MQGQRSSVEPFPELPEFDYRGTPNATGMDQDSYWNSMVLHPAETQNLSNYRLAPTDTNLPYVNMPTEGGSTLSIWNSGGQSSAEHSVDPRNHDETKMELGWPASPVVDGRSVEAANMLSVEDVGINLNSTQIDDGQSFSFSLGSNLNDIPQDLEHNIRDDAPESGFFPHPYVLSLLEHDSGSASLTSNASSSGAVGFMPGHYADRPGSSLEGRRLACKRKNTEGLAGQSSTSGSTNFFDTGENNSVDAASVRSNASAGINISGSSNDISRTTSGDEHLNTRFSYISRAAFSGPLSRVATNAESPQRNFRPRINLSRQHDVYPPNLSSSRDTSRNLSILIPNEPSPNLTPMNQAPDYLPLATGSSSSNQPHRSVIPGLPRHSNPSAWNVATNLRNDSSSSINSSDMLTAIREETLSRNTSRNDVSMQSLHAATTEVRNLPHDPVNWNVATGSASIGGVDAPVSRPLMNPGLHSSAGPALIPHQNPPTQFSRGLAEAIRRRLLASIGSESRGQSSNFSMQQSDHSPPSQEVGDQTESVSRGNHQSHIRTALLLDRQNDGVPLSTRSLAAREGRNRMISEIRNALNHMRRGENMRFEDVFMLDHPAFHRVVDLHDRHRDMRLDVDNMSYEELLALEERIGNVSTGLSEETILKCLKQRKHFTIRVGAAETEPCCICQEEYVDGEDLGTLDCGHVFHSVCIKQWLMQKNLCPICKTAALIT